MRSVLRHFSTRVKPRGLCPCTPVSSKELKMSPNNCFIRQLTGAAVDFTFSSSSTAGFYYYMPITLWLGGIIFNFAFLYRRAFSVQANNPLFRR